MLIGDWLGRRAMLSPDKVALIDAIRDGTSITYRTWNRAANRAAHFLSTLGVTKGDRVAVLAHNSVEYLDLWFACGKLGAILQTLSWRLTPRELGCLIADAKPRVLVYGPEFVEQVRAIRAAGDLGRGRSRCTPRRERPPTTAASTSVSGSATRPRRRSSWAGTTRGCSAIPAGRLGCPRAPS